MNIEKNNIPKLKIGKIFLGWIVAALMLGAASLLQGGFMAGAAVLVIVMTTMLLIFGAPVHIFLAKMNKTSDFKGHLKIVIGTLVIFFIIFVLLGVSGVFNFV